MSKVTHINEELDGIQRLEAILKKATHKRASDVHLKAGLPPIVRLDGQLFYLRDKGTTKLSRLDKTQLNEIVLSLMNEKQVDRYDSGDEVDLGYEIIGVGRYRINICQQRGEARVVCRYIPDSIKSIREMGLPKILGKLATAQRGLILVTGATGSGKSTTLAAMIDHITRTRSCHIITIEDPIEFVFKDRKSIVTQREVGQDTRDFSKALKYALRQDPDVILVGEMRDEETIRMALTAAETGHLVLSTLHTTDASETINRILSSISEGLQAQTRVQLSTQLLAVISQRLLVRKDKKGRIAAMEILIHNRRVQDILSDPKRTHSLKEVMEESRSIGMQSFDQGLMELYQRNLITKEEALTHCSNSRDFLLKLQGVTRGDWAKQGVEEGEQIAEDLNHRFDDDMELELEMDEDSGSIGDTSLEDEDEVE